MSSSLQLAVLPLTAFTLPLTLPLTVPDNAFDNDSKAFLLHLMLLLQGVLLATKNRCT